MKALVSDLRSNLKRYAELEGDIDEARDQGDFAKIDSCLREQVSLDEQIKAEGFDLIYNDGLVCWTLGLHPISDYPDAKE